MKVGKMIEIKSDIEFQIDTQDDNALIQSFKNFEGSVQITNTLSKQVIVLEIELQGERWIEAKINKNKFVPFHEDGEEIIIQDLETYLKVLNKELESGNFYSKIKKHPQFILTCKYDDINYMLSKYTFHQVSEIMKFLNQTHIKTKFLKQFNLIK